MNEEALAPKMKRNWEPVDKLVYKKSFVAPTSSTMSVRISREAYRNETSEDQRGALAAALNKAIIHFLEREIPVNLESFGLLIPSLSERSSSYTIGAYAAIRKEKLRIVEFEKCDDLSIANADRFEQIVSSAALAEEVALLLPPELCISWLNRDVRRYLRGFFKELRHEVIVHGCSTLLNEIGLFFSLHNRQGETEDDWFAGADIGLLQHFCQRLEVGSPAFFERPILDSSFEMLTAAFGPAEHTFDINLESELSALGYETAELEKSLDAHELQISVSVFRRPSQTNPNESILIYCTNGLRTLAFKDPSNSHPCGNELTFQIVEHRATDEPSHQSEAPPIWIARPLTMAWVLLQSARSKSLSIGDGLSSELPLGDSFETDLNTIFITPFSFVTSEVLSKEGPFRYLNVVGISEKESAIARNVSKNYLHMLLQHRGLDQVTRATRQSLTKTYALPSAPEKHVHTIKENNLA